MIDGVVIEEHVLLVALGIDVDGKKHVLGVREGAPENASSCTALITDMGEYGLGTDRAVIDRSMALARAIRGVFGAQTQRCQVHKARNVLDQLPDEMGRRCGRRCAMRTAPPTRLAPRFAHEPCAPSARRAPRCGGIAR